MSGPITPTRVVHVVSACSFVGVLTTALGILVAEPKATLDAVENRTLATWPALDRTTLGDGRFADGVEAFVADHFPLRQKLLQLADWVVTARGVGTPEIQVFDKSVGRNAGAEEPSVDIFEPERAVVGRDSVHDSLASSTAATGNASATIGGPDGTAPPPADAPNPTGAGSDDEAYQRTNSLIIYRGRAIQSFLVPPTVSARYARVMTRWSEALGPDVTLYLMPVPIGSDFYLPSRVRGAPDHERLSIEGLFAALPAGVVPVRTYDELAAHQHEPIYFRTDHHWTGRGAYYGYVAFARAAGFDALPMEAFSRRACGRFLGSLYSQTRSPTLSANPDSVEIFQVRNSVKVRQLLFNQRTWQAGALYVGCRGYQSFLGLDYPLMEIESDVGNDRRVLVIKDSYGNAFVPFLAAHYSKVWVVDYRYYGGSVLKLIQENAIDAVVFLHNIQVLNSPYAVVRDVALIKGGPPLPLRAAADSTPKTGLTPPLTPERR